MSAAASTEMALPILSPLVVAASEGRLPAWARVTPPRLRHIDRVAALMNRWAAALDLPDEERARWSAAAWLHDVLRDADEAELREILGGEFTDFPTPLLHGPAAARKLAADGVSDAPLLLAVRYHTLGHRDLDDMGRALYLADFLEPGRDFAVEWRGELRERMPAERVAVLREVVDARLEHLERRGLSARPETVGFHQAVSAGSG